MIKPGSLAWFARHELRLAWRETLSMMTAGRRGRERKVVIGVAFYVVILHAVAFLILAHVSNVAPQSDLPTLIGVTAGIVLTGSAMLSQAMESVTRTFYTRADLDLILSSPARANRLFAVRIGAIALSVSLMSLLLAGPMIDVLAWRGGVRWLSAYAEIAAVASLATALGIVLTIALFSIIGPRRTRLAAQIGAAIIGGGFVIGLQMAALFSTGTISRLAFLQSHYVLMAVPGIASAFWWPARAALGDTFALAAVTGAGFALLAAAIRLSAPRFAAYSAVAASVSPRPARHRRAGRAFFVRTASATLRRKERMLLSRDPWLMSQSLMQVLYLLPPAVLLWHNFAFGGNAAIMLVPVLIMAAGQLAGGLAWLTISGEDAPDLVLTAPVAQPRIWRAKIEAVMQCVGVVFLPLLIGLVWVSPRQAFIAAIGIGASTASAGTIQLWFRSQAKRSQFRRRHTSSRIATFSEAFSSIAWAATGAIAAAGSWLAAVAALIALGILASCRFFSPTNTLGDTSQ